MLPPASMPRRLDASVPGFAADFETLLADREAIVLGQGVAMPMRIRFAEVTRSVASSLRHHGFSDAWKKENMNRAVLEDTISRWRSLGRNRG